MIELWSHARRIVADGAATGKAGASPAAVSRPYGTIVMLRFAAGGATGAPVSDGSR